MAALHGQKRNEISSARSRGDDMCADARRLAGDSGSPRRRGPCRVRARMSKLWIAVVALSLASCERHLKARGGIGESMGALACSAAGDCPSGQKCHQVGPKMECCPCEDGDQSIDCLLPKP